MNETARMTVPALLRRAITVCEQDRKDDGARGVGRYPSVNETARMTIPALLDGGATRAARGRDEGDIPLRDGTDHDNRVGERRRNEGGTRAR